MQPSVRQPGAGARRAYWRSFGIGATGTLAALALIVLWILTPSRERDAIVKLPASERRALYERTRQTLESTCETARERTGLDDYCRAQARFLVEFPECDAACLTLTARCLARATR